MQTRFPPDARDGDTVQIEATVTQCEVQLRPRRMLKVTVDDGTGTCVLTFFSFYPSQQKTMAVGTQLRIRGEIKGGFWGRQMMHPAFKVAGGELPQALTPVYPTAAGLPQPYLRRAIASAMQQDAAMLSLGALQKLGYGEYAAPHCAAQPHAAAALASAVARLV